MTTLLPLVQGINYLFSHILVGSVVFYFLIFRPENKKINTFAKTSSNFIRLLFCLVTFFSILWIALSAHEMADSWVFEDFWTAIANTSFGYFGCMKIIFLIVVIFLFNRILKFKYSPQISLLIVFILPFFSIIVGQAGVSTDYRLVRISLGWAHSISVGIWTGGGCSPCIFG